jgi:hypothetical protein
MARKLRITRNCLHCSHLATWSFCGNAISREDASALNRHICRSVGQKGLQDAASGPSKAKNRYHATKIASQ